VEALVFRAASTAARSIVPPPAACTVSMLRPNRQASFTAEATVLGMSVVLEIEKDLASGGDQVADDLWALAV